MVSGKWFNNLFILWTMWSVNDGAAGDQISCIYSPSTSKKSTGITNYFVFFAGGSPAATSLTDHTVCMNSNLYHSQLKDLHLKFIYSEKATKFCEIFTVDLTVTTYRTNLQWRFRKNLWPSQNIWTLWLRLASLENYKLQFILL